MYSIFKTLIKIFCLVWALFVSDLFGSSREFPWHGGRWFVGFVAGGRWRITRAVSAYTPVLVWVDSFVLWLTDRWWSYTPLVCDAVFSVWLRFELLASVFEVELMQIQIWICKQSQTIFQVFPKPVSDHAVLEKMSGSVTLHQKTGGKSYRPHSEQHHFNILNILDISYFWWLLWW